MIKNELTAQRQALQTELASLDQPSHVAALQNALDEAAASGDAETIQDAARALQRAQTGQDLHGAKRLAIAAKIKALDGQLHDLAEVEAKALRERLKRQENELLGMLTNAKATLKAANDLAYSEHLKVVAVQNELYRVQHALRGSGPRGNYAHPDPLWTVAPPIGWGYEATTKNLDYPENRRLNTSIQRDVESMVSSIE